MNKDQYEQYLKDNLIALISKKTVSNNIILTENKRYSIIGFRKLPRRQEDWITITDDEGKDIYFSFDKYEDWFVPVLRDSEPQESNWRQDYLKNKGER